MKSESVVTVVQPNGVATITLNRPDVHNAFDDGMAADLTAVLRNLDADDQVALVILGGAGRSFCAGADLNWMRRTAADSEEENLRDGLALAELMRVLDRLGKPTIARVHGAVFGGGVGLVACADIAIADEGAVFSLSEVRLGLIPAVISPYVLRAIGARQARRYLLTGERFSAAEAQRIGLVHEMAPAKELDRRVEGVSSALRQAGPFALTAAKALLSRMAHQPIDQATIRYTAERIAAVRASEEGREGVAAFLEKRPPKWRR